MKRTIPLTAGLLVVAATACGDDSGDAARALIEAPADGATVAGAVTLTMSASGIAIEPAGEVRDDAGHFHVIADHGCVTTGDGITKDADHIHFGDGSTTGKIYLGPGKHTLCLQVGDGQHTALDITDTVEIDVGITSTDQWCDVLTETDEIVASLGDHDFAAVQARAANAVPLVDQLLAATDHVDDEVRPAVEQFVTFAKQMLETYVDAPSAAEAESRIWGSEGLFAQYTDDELDAIEHDAGGWFQSTCGVTVLD